MITVHLCLDHQKEIKPLDGERLVIYLHEPTQELSRNEFYAALDGLNFSLEEFNAFSEELTTKEFFSGTPFNQNALINEQKKYILIRLFNLTQLINSLVGDSCFVLHFDKKVLEFPQLTVLLGDNKESPKVFLHDIRDTLYPLLRIFYGKQRCVYKPKILNINLYLRTCALFLLTLIKCFTQVVLSSIKVKNVTKYIDEELKGKKCLVLVRAEKQINFLERIASNSAMQDVQFLVFSEVKINKIQRSVSNIKLIRLSRFQYLHTFVSVFTKSFFTFSSTFFTKKSLEKNQWFELNSIFSHLFWFDAKALLLDIMKANSMPVISFEMVGRHAQMHQSLCEARSLPLHRFQVASIEPRHVAQLTSYGKFWALDNLSYQQLKAVFPEQISFDSYISPHIDMSTVEYSPKRIMFATQPYGEEDNYKIIRNLLRLAGNSSQIVIRRHPRDKIDYQIKYPEVAYDDIADAIESIACSRLVVSKTSTILQDCYNLNVPYLSVLFDEYSQSVDLFFTKVEGKFCTNETDFFSLLNENLDDHLAACSPVLTDPMPLNKIRRDFVS